MFSGLNSQRHYTSLNLIRGLAALVVLAHHVRNQFFVPFDKIPNPTLPEKAIIFVCGLGPAAVIVFFVLSGFFISSSIIKAAVDNKWSWGKYLIARLSRLYVVLVPALALTLLWDRLGSLWGLPDSTPGRESLPVLFGNLLFLQKIYFPTYGSNDPLWSLSYEFWYYIIFPLIFFAAYDFSAPLYKRISVASLAAILLFVTGKNIAMYFLIWLLGFVLVIIGNQERSPQKPGLLSSFTSILAAVIFLSSLALDRLHLIGSQFLNDAFIGIAFSVFAYALLNIRQEPNNKLYSFAADRLAGFSYTLYLVHFPLVGFLGNSVLKVQNSWNFDLLHMCYGILIIALVIVYAITVWRFTEAKTGMVRFKVTELLS